MDALKLLTESLPFFMGIGGYFGVFPKSKKPAII